MNRRIDLRIARAELDVLAKSLGLTQATRFVSDVDLLGNRIYERSVKIDAETGAVDRETSRRRQVEIDFEIPIFDFGQTKVVQAEEAYMQAANKLAEKAVNIRSEARETYQSYRGNYDIARTYQTQVLPLRKVIQDESVLQYSGMLIDVTDLLADARAPVSIVCGRDDHWVGFEDAKSNPRRRRLSQPNPTPVIPSASSQPSHSLCAAIVCCPAQPYLASGFPVASAASVGVVLSGTGSVKENVQRLGRILRKYGDKQATLYEIIARGTAEEYTSDRRRQHGAFQ